MKKTVLIFVLSISQLLPVSAKPAVIHLWDGVRGMKYQNTLLYVFCPEQTAVPHGTTAVQISTTAVLICPGGSYHHLGMSGEGYTTAHWFNNIGITAFVLKYRVSRDGYHYPAMFEDFERAMQYIREHAGTYGIDPHKIGAIGYSAGGHMVLMGAEYGDSVNELAKLGIHTKVRFRPDFVMPIYPVVSMQDSIAHTWSRWSLLGYHPTQQQKDFLSMEMHITPDMPPVYNVVARDDKTVDYRNSLVLCDALLKAGVPYVSKVYETGGHGFGMKNGDFMCRTHWNKDLETWLMEKGFLEQY